MTFRITTRHELEATTVQIEGRLHRGDLVELNGLLFRTRGAIALDSAKL